MFQFLLIFGALFFIGSTPSFAADQLPYAQDQTDTVHHWEVFKNGTQTPVTTILPSQATPVLPPRSPGTREYLYDQPPGIFNTGDQKRAKACGSATSCSALSNMVTQAPSPTRTATVTATRTQTPTVTQTETETPIAPPILY